MSDTDNATMSLAAHFDALRKVLLRILVITLVAGIAAFCCKNVMFQIILAPLNSDFVTFHWVETTLGFFGVESLRGVTPALIATDISSQFMAHLSMSFYMGLLLASPYIAHALLGYILPALYRNERRYAIRISVAVYILFFIGLLLSYFIMFPIACRFLGSYSISPAVTTMVDISSYLGLFISLTLLLGLVFQLPVVMFILTKAGFITPRILRHYRRHAVVAIAVLAAIITPPDVLTLILVALPLYTLYEFSIIVTANVVRNKKSSSGKVRDVMEPATQNA